MLTLADSRLPIGGHVHSGGIEQAIADRMVTDAASLRDFVHRRLHSSALVGASVAASVADGVLDETRAQVEVDARTPSAAARAASLAQGRGLLRLARRRWPAADYTAHVPRSHLPVITGTVGRMSGLDGHQSALVFTYTAMTGMATAGQRLLALDPAEVAIVTLDLAPLCAEVAARAARDGLADLSDPLFDVLAERHQIRDMPLFAS
ncbi:urease accessory protein UreF [Williamsia sp. CHRR-6]|nr:urease accessory protein UreF [Williamsia sp. CHRR-6]